MNKKIFRINKLFESQFTTMGSAKTSSPIVTTAKAPKNVGKKKPPIIQHSKFTDDNMSESDFAALVRKSEKSGIDIDILGEVFDRGIDAWSEDVDLSPQQFAFNRVNSFISEGKAFKEDDADLAEAFGRRKDDATRFSNWKFDLKPGQRTKVLHGDHKGKRGEVLGKIDQKDGPIYRIKHDDGTIMKHHISTLDEPEDSNKTGFGVRRVSEDVEMIKSAPSLKAVANKHGVDVGSLQDDLESGIKVEMEHTKDREVAEKIALQHLEERPDYYKRLKSCVENLEEARPINNAFYDHTEKMYDDRKKFWEKREKEKSKKDLDEGSKKPYVKPHYGDSSRPDKQTAWKSSNKHGKVKIFGLDFKSAASKHAGLVEESAMTHEELEKEMAKYDAAINRFGGKLVHTTPKHSGSALSGYVVGHDPQKDNHVKLRVDHARGVRSSGDSSTKDYSVHVDHLTNDYSKSKAMLGEGCDSPTMREIGTKSLSNKYKKDTPGQAVSEEVTAADRKPMIIRPFKKEVVDPDTGERSQINVKGHVKTAPTKKRIIKSGNLSDGKPSV